LRKTYCGEPLEKGGTSISAGVSPTVKWLFKQGYIKSGQKILDYGAGKYSRNANWLREKGCEVYAYDPYNYNDEDPWKKNGVSNKLTRHKFDVGLSVFVLCVVRKKDEKDIKKYLSKKCKKNFYVNRGTELVDSVKWSIVTVRDPVISFYKEYKNSFRAGERTPSIEDFCKYGVKTKRGFQRLSEPKSLKKIKETRAFRIFSD